MKTVVRAGKVRGMMATKNEADKYILELVCDEG